MSMLISSVVTLSGLWVDTNSSEDDNDSMSLQNVGIYMQVHVALQPRRPTLTVRCVAK
jgi:hypothetical protein